VRLAGKTALITGGASGIGRATALRFAAEGAAVLIADLNEAEGRATATEIERAGGRAGFYSCDLSAEDQVAGVFERVRARQGGLHVLVAAAGILQGAFQPVDELELSTFARVLEVNVLGAFLACKHAAPLIRASGGGVILCLSSGGGVSGPSSSLAYGASKAGVLGFCHTLEAQLASQGVRVHAVCPGSLDTPMKRQNIRDRAAATGRDPEAELAATPLGDPDGVAKVLAFLASEDADYVRGTVFTR